MKLQNATEHSFQLVVGKPIKPSVGLTESRNVITLKNVILKTATLIFHCILNSNWAKLLLSKHVRFIKTISVGLVCANKEERLTHF